MPSRERVRRCVVRRLHVEETMAEGAEGFIPRTSSLARLASAANRCRGCDLYRFASRAIFGEGPRTSAIVLVGEQPGDQEDRTGHPFVGPAGGLLDRALVEAGMERARVYVTNAVKHFKFVPRGKKRIHQKPGASEIEACRPWLYRELEVIRPGLLLCLEPRPPAPYSARDSGSSSSGVASWPLRRPSARSRPEPSPRSIRPRRCGPRRRPSGGGCSGSSSPI